jgi:predicted metal-binding membrane protein
MRSRASSVSSTDRERLAAVAVLGGLIVAAWAGLVALALSPYGGLLDHGRLEHLDDVGTLAPLVGGWTVMVVAMMLPASLPLIRLFRRMVGRRADTGRLVGLLVAGYLLVWTAFGLALHAGDIGVHRAVAELGWLERNEWAILASALLAAGLFQFSGVKHRCLAKCRSPRLFVAERWGRRPPSRGAFVLGVEHGVFCVGCCAGLMLVMFAVGVGSLAWMLALTTVAAAERSARSGRALAAPVGIALIAASALVPLSA